jgi:hypothetical protein
MSIGWHRYGVLALLSVLYCTTTGTALGAGDPGKRAGGLVPHYGQAVAASGGARARAAGGGFDLPPTPGALSYHGGRVMHSVTVRHVFWVPSGYSLPANYRTLIDTFMGDVAADSGKKSNVYSSDTQYTDTTTGHILYSVAFGGSVLITDPFPAGATTSRADCPLDFKATCLTDTELEQKLESVAVSNGWPLHTFTNGYAIFTPPGVDVCIDWIGGAFGHPCTYNAFCAYHTWGDSFAPPWNPTMIYAVEPAFANGEGCNDSSFTSPNGDFTTDITINTLNHETNEFITDPTPADSPYGGWYDANINENADKCAYNYGTRIGMTGGGALYNQLINGHPYMLQRSWSNAVVPGTGASGCYSIGAPTISSLSPLSVAAGGDVGISGTNFFFPFGATPVVKFNGIASPSVTVDSPTHITAEVPAGKAGGKITVVGTVGGDVISGQTFGLQPTITSLSAASGFAGENITVTGTGFFGVTSVKFNGAAGAFSAVSIDGTSLHVVVPNAATTGTVTVTTVGGTGASSTTFVVLPHVTGFTPAAAVAGANVTISGTGFSGVPTVDFTGSAGAVLVSHTATSLMVHVPGDAVNGPLTVTTADGSSASVAPFNPLMKITGFGAVNYRAGELVTVNGFNFLATGADPTAKLGAVVVVPGSVTSTSFQFTVPDNGLTATVSATNANGTANSPTTLKVRPRIDGDPVPNEGKAGDHIVLTGKTFTGTTSVKFNGTVVAPFTVAVGGASLNVTVPNAAVDGPIAVTNAGGTTSTIIPFKVDPKLVSFSPLAAAGGANVTISGTGFGTSPVVQFTGAAAPATLGVHTATSIVAVVPPDAHNGTITVSTANGDATSVASFKPLMKITGFGAANYQAGGTVTVNGTNFLATGVNPTAKLGLLAVTPGSVTDTSFQFTVPDNGLTATVSATNANGTANSPTTLKVRPTIDESFSPNHGLTGTVVTLTGKTFTGTSSVKIGGVAAPFSLLAGALKVTVPAAAVTGPISVTNAGGTSTTSGSFTVDPKITSFTPTSGSTGATITVSGSGFGGADRVNFAGAVFGVPTNVTATTLKVAVPAGATTGPITVHTPAGTSASSAASFTVTFSVTSISPTSAVYNHDVTITGIGLTGVTAVKFNNIPGTSLSITGTTVIHVNTPSSGNISGIVTVWKGTASVAAPQQFSVLDITSFLPTAATPGTDVVITGHGFTGATGVAFHGLATTFTVDSGTQITAQVPDGATTGTVSVTGPGGAATSSGSFTVESLATVKINEVQTGGSTGQDEFVELYNGGSGPADISGCKLVYRTASGTSDVVLATVPASTTIPAGGFFLFGGNDYAGTGPSTADATFTVDLDATGGGLALRYPSGTIVDRVGYGSATNVFVDGTVAAAPPSGESIGRDSTGTDTDDNSADFVIIASPTPRLVNP